MINSVAWKISTGIRWPELQVERIFNHFGSDGFAEVLVFGAPKSCPGFWLPYPVLVQNDQLHSACAKAR
jgi:hypothetical protein